jgi:hypothetical protein
VKKVTLQFFSQKSQFFFIFLLVVVILLVGVEFTFSPFRRFVMFFVFTISRNSCSSTILFSSLCPSSFNIQTSLFRSPIFYYLRFGNEDLVTELVVILSNIFEKMHQCSSSNFASRTLLSYKVTS